MIWLSSDLHLNHDREFIWKARGFDSVQEMNKSIISKWNSLISDGDEVYILGDVMLGNTEDGMHLLSQLNGQLHLIRGNHDTDNRISWFYNSGSFTEICDAKYLRYSKYHFYLTHYPCLTGNLEKEKLSQMTLNLHGHTHSQNKFFYDLPYCYNVGIDSHGCIPISIDQIIYDMENKVQECKQFL